MINVKKTIKLILFCLLILIVIIFFLNSKDSNWSLIKSPYHSQDSYWDGLILEYNGLFNPTIKYIKVISNEKLIYKPLIDKNNNFTSFSKKQYDENLKNGMFDLINVNNFDLKNKEKRIIIGIENEKLKFYESPLFIEIEYKIFFRNYVKNLRLPY